MAESRLVIEIEGDRSVGASPPPPAAPTPAAPPMTPAGSFPTSVKPAGTAFPAPSGPLFGPAPAPPRPASTVAPMPGADPERPQIDERKAQRDMMRAEIEARRERAAEAKRQTEEFKKRQAEEAERMKKEAENDRAWNEARTRAKTVVAKERAGEDTLNAIKQSRDARVKATERSEARAASLGKWAGRAGAGAQLIGAAAAGAAGGGMGSALSGAVDKAANGLAVLGPYGMAAGAALRGLKDSVTAVTDTVDAFTKRGRELAGFNGQIAGAAASADLRSMMSDMREANSNANEFAKLIETQSKLENSFREVMIPIQRFIMETLAVLLTRLVELGVAGIDGLNDILDTVGTKSKKLEEIVSRIKGIMEERDVVSPIEDLLDAAKGFVAPDAVAPRRADGGGKLAMPILGAFK